MNPRYHVLFVDDQWDDYPRLPSRLRDLGIVVQCEAEAAHTVPRIEAGPLVDVLLLDLMFPGQPVEGDQVFAEVRSRWPALPVVIITSRDSIAMQRDYLRRGAAGYVYKEGLTPEEVAGAIELAVQRSRWKQLHDRFGEDFDGELVGQSASFSQVLILLRRAATSSSPCLLTGAAGTGKSFFGRWLHRIGARRDGPLVTLQAEDASVEGLFGGQFPGLLELSSSGTLILEDAERLLPGMTARLAAALDSGALERAGAARALETRLLFTTREVEEFAASAGRLYYVVAPWRIDLPPLASRRDDLDALAEHFLRRYERSERLPPHRLSEEARGLLRGYSYSGNLSELRMLVDRAAARASGEEITSGDVGLDRVWAAFSIQEQARWLLDGRKTTQAVLNDLDDAADLAGKRMFPELVATLIRMYRAQHGSLPQLKQLVGRGLTVEELERKVQLFQKRLSRAKVSYRGLLRQAEEE